MFGWFESRIAPFPDDGLTEPPKSLVAFCRHYTHGVWPAIAVMAVLTATIAVAEVSLYAFLGSIVDWLSERTNEVHLLMNNNMSNYAVTNARDLQMLLNLPHADMPEDQQLSLDDAT